MNDLKLKCVSIFVVVLTILLFCSCSDSSDDASLIKSELRPSKNILSPKCKVVSFSIINMYFDELKNLTLAGNPNFTERLNLSYSNNRIVQVQGGLWKTPSGGSQTYYFWRNDFVEDVVYSENKITVNSVGFYSKEFVIAHGKIQSQKTTYNPGLSFLNIVNYSSGLHEYQYIGNTIVETTNGQTRRIFYIENGNLVKVELFFRDATNQIYKKIEYLLSNYDNTPNLLKGKFFIHGNFFKAFSNNNFKKFEMKAYNFVEGTYQLDPNEYAQFTFNSIPADMFIQDCN